MNESFEIVVAHEPFTVRRTVKWSDCDPAGIVFTGRFPEYLMGATGHFMRHLRSGPGAADLRAAGVDTPCKGLALVFHAPLYPDNVVDVVVGVGAIRESSFDLVARACLPDGRLAFDGTFSPICIRREPRGRVPIPQSLRERLAAHRLPPAPTQEGP